MAIYDSLVKENYELRADARAQLSGNWGTAALLYLIFFLLCGALGFIPVVGYIANFIIVGPLTLGLTTCFLRLVRREPLMFETLFDGFKNFASALLLQLLMGLFIMLWSLLLIVPGIIAALSYSMAFYILHDNPEMSALDALRASKEMMRGYKWKYFCLQFSFIGWGFLCIFTCFIGTLWLTPYIYTSSANFYQNLKNASSGDNSSTPNFENV